MTSEGKKQLMEGSFPVETKNEEGNWKKSTSHWKNGGRL